MSPEPNDNQCAMIVNDDVVLLSPVPVDTGPQRHNLGPERPAAE